MPHGVYTGLRWLEKHIGIPFHTEDVQVVDISRVPGSHEAEQVTPMKYAVWNWIEKQTMSSNDFVSMLACTWCVLVLGVLRFAHAQRSRITALTPVAIHMSATRGKRRQQGRTRPFAHRCPRLCITSRDFGKCLFDFLHRAAASNNRTELPYWLQWDWPLARGSWK